MNNSGNKTMTRRPFLLVISFIGIAIGAYLLLDFESFSSEASETEGQIVARDGVRFTIEYTVDGRMYRITEDLPSAKGMSGLSRSKLQPGSKVIVLYDPSSPGNARWQSSRNWIFPVLVLLLAVLAGVGGLFPGIFAKSLRRG